MIFSEQIGLMAVTLSNGEHKIISDLSNELGGENSGLNPHELIEAALGACTIQTLKLYSKRKNWDLTDLKVEIKIIREGAESLIERNIFFGDVPDGNKKRLLEIADKCPIHKLLVSSIKILTHATSDDF